MTPIRIAAAGLPAGACLVACSSSPPPTPARTVTVTAPPFATTVNIPGPAATQRPSHRYRRGPTGAVDGRYRRGRVGGRPGHCPGTYRTIDAVTGDCHWSGRGRRDGHVGMSAGRARAGPAVRMSAPPMTGSPPTATLTVVSGRPGTPRPTLAKALARRRRPAKCAWIRDGTARPTPAGRARSPRRHAGVEPAERLPACW